MVKLCKEEKLKIIEPTDQVKESYIQKSKSSIRSANILIENEQLEDATAMTYYSMYNMLIALLYKAGIKCENHAAAIIILKELFKFDNSSISFAKTERVDKQYYIDFKISKEDVKDLIKKAEEFNAMLYGFIDSLTKKQIVEYREELSKALVDKR